MKIVLIDDEPVVLKGLKTIIENSCKGWEIIGDAEDGLRGLRLVEEKIPDLIITDIKIPGIDGMEMIKKIRGKNRDVLIIILSGCTDITYIQKATELGSFAYLFKPIKYTDILNCLSKAEKTIEMREKA